MKSRRLVLALAATMLVAFPPAVRSAQDPTAESPSAESPSLDRLRERVLEHWDLLAGRNRIGAAEFIQGLEERNSFITSELPTFVAPRIQGFDLEDYPDGVRVRVEVTLPVRGLEWTVYNAWVSDGDEWFLTLGDRDSLGIYSSAPRPDNSDELLVASFQEGFRPQTLVLPDDAFGNIISGTIDYSFDGANRIQLTRIRGPEGLTINQSDLESIVPGAGSINYTFVGNELFDNNLPDLVLRLTQGNLTSDVSIPVVWNGTPDYRYRYVPASPEVGYQGEIVLEIDNLTQETWRPGAVEFLNGRLALSSSPEAPVGPGQTARFTLETTSPLSADPGSMVVRLSPERINVPYPRANPETPAVPQNP